MILHIEKEDKYCVTSSYAGPQHSRVESSSTFEDNMLGSGMSSLAELGHSSIVPIFTELKLFLIKLAKSVAVKLHRKEWKE